MTIRKVNSKYAGGVLVRNGDVVDQWLVKWEQTFQMCEITDDQTPIDHASFNLQDVAHKWWRKVVKDKKNLRHGMILRLCLSMPSFLPMSV